LEEFDDSGSCVGVCGAEVEVGLVDQVRNAFEGRALLSDGLGVGDKLVDLLGDLVSLLGEVAE
jgi:hypothetical protein